MIPETATAQREGRIRRQEGRHRKTAEPETAVAQGDRRAETASSAAAGRRLFEEPAYWWRHQTGHVLSEHLPKKTADGQRGTASASLFFLLLCALLFCRFCPPGDLLFCRFCRLFCRRVCPNRDHDRDRDLFCRATASVFCLQRATATATCFFLLRSYLCPGNGLCPSHRCYCLFLGRKVCPKRPAQCGPNHRSTTPDCTCPHFLEPSFAHHANDLYQTATRQSTLPFGEHSGPHPCPSR